MSVRVPIVLAALAASLAPAAAADIAGGPSGGPPGAFSICGPSPAAVAVQDVKPTLQGWWQAGDHPRIIFVERFDPRRPPAFVTPKYVIPQTAYLASSLCDYPDGYSQRSWYDGKLFYIPGGNRSAPDTFMVIERN
jgi:hypothetical protein